MQRITLIGNIGNDAKLVQTSTGEFVSFQVACTTTRKNGEQVAEITNWYDCTTENTKLQPYLKKGTQIYVDGGFKLEQYFSEQQNKFVPKIRVFANIIQLLSSPKKEESSQPEINEQY